MKKRNEKNLAFRVCFERSKVTSGKYGKRIRKAHSVTGILENDKSMVVSLRSDPDKFKSG